MTFLTVVLSNIDASTLILAGTVCVLTMAGWKVVVYPFLMSPLRDLPSPPGGSLLMGHYAELSAADRLRTPITHWTNTVTNSGLIRFLGAFNQEWLIVCSRDGIRELLNQRAYEFIKPPSHFGGFRRKFGKGLLIAEGDAHKVQRKILTPAFSFRRVKDLYPVFWNKSRELVNALSSELRQDLDKNGIDEHYSTVIDFVGWSERLALDIIGSAAIAQEFNSIHDPTTTLPHAYRQALRSARPNEYLVAISSLLPQWIVDHMLVWERRETKEAYKIIRQTSRDVLDERAAALKDGKATSVDVISAAISSNVFSTSELIDQMFLFVAAGHHTTMSALSWTVLFLCQHPHVQTRLREEIHTNLPSLGSESPITAADVDSLPYLNAVCNESLRVRSPITVTVREAAQPTSLLGQYVPKGTAIVICPHWINTAPDMWGPDAAEFKPERWMGEKKRQSEANCMLTFLDGPRTCIGQGFARSEMKCSVAALVGSFSMELKSPHDVIKTRGNFAEWPAQLEVRLREVGGW